MCEKLTLIEAKYIFYAKRELYKILENKNSLDYIKTSPNFEYVMHIIAHRDAFKTIEKNTKYSGLFSNQHDIEKIGLSLVLGKNIAKQIHRKWADHHNIDWDNPDPMILVEKLLDYESCHYTKLNSQETAYEYSLVAHPDKMLFIEPVLKELKIWKHENTEKLTPEQYIQILEGIDDNHILEEVQASYEYIKTYM